jgi:ADP-ribose pyrophosphatase
VAILAFDDEDRLLLVRQFRAPARRVLLEIPAGTLDRDDDGMTEDPFTAAQRELEEETGMRAGTWERLGSWYSAPGFTEELMHLYLATGLTPAGDGRLTPDHDEHLLLERRRWSDAVAAVERGEIVDGKSIIGIFWLARRRSDAT